MCKGTARRTADCDRGAAAAPSGASPPVRLAASSPASALRAAATNSRADWSLRGTMGRSLLASRCGSSAAFRAKNCRANVPSPPTSSAPPPRNLLRCAVRPPTCAGPQTTSTRSSAGPAPPASPLPQPPPSAGRGLGGSAGSRAASSGCRQRPPAPHGGPSSDQRSAASTNALSRAATRCRPSTTQSSSDPGVQRSPSDRVAAACQVRARRVSKCNKI
mmetsp:Transcript_41234/g.132804  ORF Transcript_41234/g.132804 Transcript_41234/m.132804 type:complete len:218 (+) Transcript_41234:142-795(+)